MREDTPLSGTQIIEVFNIFSYVYVLKLYVHCAVKNKTGLKQLDLQMLTEVHTVRFLRVSWRTFLE